MIISIASGKGGTGKTTVAVNLALTLENVTLIDCDVEEPNSGLFFKQDDIKESAVEIQVPAVDPDKCNHCGECQKVCEFSAILVTPKKTLIFDDLCHQCGACSLFCPNDAIHDIPKTIGIKRISKAQSGIKLIEGKSNIGVANIIPIIESAKSEIGDEAVVIIDAPPGTSCPVIHSVEGSDLCLLVTEPTPFGLNDLKLAAGMLDELKIPYGVVINRSDIGNNETDDFCAENKIPILARIPFSREVAELYSKGIPPVTRLPEYRKIFEKILEDAQILIQTARG